MKKRKLENVIKEFMIETLGVEQIDRRYPRFLLSAIRCLRELNYGNISTYSKDVELDVNDNDTVDLPDDFIDYEVIGVICNGELFSLGYNPNLAPKPKDNCGNDISRDTVSTDGVFQAADSAIDSYMGSLGGGNSLGYYKIFPNKGYISLEGFDADKIVLRYKADIEQVDGSFMVNPYDEEAIHAWLGWKYKNMSKGYNDGDKMFSYEYYKRMKRQSLIRHNRFSLPEWVDAIRKAFRPSPRI